MTTEERVYVLGGTGSVGIVTVKELLRSKTPVTLYARSPANAQRLFGDDSNLMTVKGDLVDRKPFKDLITGHTRLVLSVDVVLKILHVVPMPLVLSKSYTSVGSTFPWRSSYLGEIHRSSEEGIASIPNRGAHVALRPAHFMSNLLWLKMNTIKTANAIIDKVDPETGRQWISTNDVGLVAANILQDPIEKHGDAVYEMIGDTVSMKNCAAFLIKILGREISYMKATLVDMYHSTIEKGFLHVLAYEFSMYLPMPNQVTPGLSILLGREPETLAQWLEANKTVLFEVAVVE